MSEEGVKYKLLLVWKECNNNTLPQKQQYAKRTIKQHLKRATQDLFTTKPKPKFDPREATTFTTTITKETNN
jgi:hypothetical protein